MMMVSKIYLTDDDPDDCEFFEMAVNQLSENIDLTIKNSGSSLLSEIADSKNIPELIFLDINMPGYNGFDILKALRSNSITKKLPVVMYSTSAHTGEIQKAYDAGAFLYLVKPADLNVLRNQILNILQIDWSSFVRSKNLDKFIVQ